LIETKNNFVEMVGIGCSDGSTWIGCLVVIHQVRPKHRFTVVRIVTAPHARLGSIINHGCAEHGKPEKLDQTLAVLFLLVWFSDLVLWHPTWRIGTVVMLFICIDDHRGQPIGIMGIR